MIAPCTCPTDPHRRELKTHGSLAFPAACYENTAQTLPVPWHWHDELELSITERGSVAVHIGAETFRMEQGEGCFINAGVLHAFEQAGTLDATEHAVVFHPRLVGGSMDSVFWQKYVLPLTSDRSLTGFFLRETVSWQKELLSGIRQAWEICAYEQPDYEIAARDALSRCTAILCRRQAAQTVRPSEKAIRQNERMKAMLSYIEQHFWETVTVRQIAGSACISESECMRCFRRTIGMAPVAYLNSYRLQCAADLLRNTQLAVGAVACRCGFQEMSYFARAFRRVYGCTPSAYRNARAAADL